MTRGAFDFCAPLLYIPPVRSSVLLVLLAVSSVGCRPKPSEPEGTSTAKSADPSSGQPDAPYRGKIGGAIGKLGKPMIDLTPGDLRTALQSVGWKPSGFTEMDSSVAVTRTIPIQKEKLAGTVQWFKTTDKEKVHSTMVLGWPSAEDGDVIIAVRLASESQRADARKLLKALTQD